MSVSPPAAAPPSNRAERLLVPATLITCLGNSIQLTAAALLVVRAEQTALAVGWLFIAVAVPQALLSLSFGRLADRFDRRILCLVCDLISAMMALALPIWLLLGGPTGLSVYLTNFVLAIVSALFIPASNALIKERVRAERLGRFNANFEMATQAGTLLSSAIGGFLVQLFGAQPLFFFNAATFLASAACWIAIGPRPATAEGRHDGRTAEAVPVRAPLARLGLLYAIGNVIVTVNNTLIVVLVVQFFRQGAGVLGVVDSLAGVGVLTAAALYTRVRGRFGDLRIAFAGYLGCAAFIALQPQRGVVGMMFFLPAAALTFGLARIAARTMLMTAVTEDRAGRVFGATNAFGLAFSVAATLAVSGVVDRTQAPYGALTLALLVAVTASFTVAALCRAHPTGRLAGLPSSGQPKLLETAT